MLKGELYFPPSPGTCASRAASLRYMTVAVRVPITLSSDPKKIRGDPKVISAGKAQLNEAEYAGPLIAMLLFCASKNIDAPISATLCSLGQVIYFWGRITVGDKAAPAGALPRYAGMIGLAYALFGALF